MDQDSSTEEEEEQFFETLEDIASSSDAESGAEEICNTASSEGVAKASNALFSKYEVWKSNPGSIMERRQRLFTRMGLKEDKEDSEMSVVLVDASSALSSTAQSLSKSDCEQKDHKRTNANRRDEDILRPATSFVSASSGGRAIMRSRSDGTFSRIQSIENTGAPSARLSRSGATSPVLHRGMQKKEGVTAGSVIRTGSGLAHLPSKPPLGGQHVKSRRSPSSSDSSVAQKPPFQWKKLGRCRVTDKNGNSLFHSDQKHSEETRAPSLPHSNNGVSVDNMLMCRIKDLDSGKEFVVNEVGRDGMWNKLKDLDTGREITLEEFESSLGLSPIVQEVMRRERAANDRSTWGGIPSKTVTAVERRKNSWFNVLKGVVKGSREKGNSSQAGSGSEKECSTERSSRKSGSATDDSQDAPLIARPVKVRVHKKSTKEFGDLCLRQEIQAHQGAIWTMKFSLDGSYLATAGQDGIVKVWEIIVHSSSPKVSPSSSGEINSVPGILDGNQKHCSSKRSNKSSRGHSDSISQIPVLFMLSEDPKCTLKGHKEEVLDLSWSQSQSLLSSSMDKTVRLWNISSNSCLKIFPHNDYVTCIQFHPSDPGHFLSGSLDGKVRIWCVQDPQVVDWVDLQEMVTAACYTPNGQGAVVGSYKGTCRFYKTPGNKLQLDTTFEVRNTKTKRSEGKKITGFQFVPDDLMKILITSNDSRIRVYDGTEISSKFKGFRNSKSQISASFSRDGRFIICASEDSRVCIWNYDDSSHDHSNVQRSISGAFEDFSAKNVLVAIPWPGLAGHANSAVLVDSGPNEPQKSLMTSDPASKERSLSALRTLSDMSGTISENRMTFSSMSNVPDADLSRAVTNPPSPTPDFSSKSLRSDPYQDNCCGSSLLPNCVSNCVPAQHIGNNGFFPDCKGSATWPEEKLPSLQRRSPASHRPLSLPNKKASAGEPNNLTTMSSAYGLVIVTGGMGGEIRVFQNYSLPVRL